MVGCAQTGTLWAAGGGEWPGAGVWRSDDAGQTWDLSLLANGKFDDWLRNYLSVAEYTGRTAAPPAPYTGQVEAIWSLAHAGGALFAGVKPAALYVSHDRGDSWARVDALSNHPSAPDWQPGGAGLVLHSIVADPAIRQSCGWGYPRQAYWRPRMVAIAGTAATACRTRITQPTTTPAKTLPMKPGIACITSCARRGRVM